MKLSEIKPLPEPVEDSYTEQSDAFNTPWHLVGAVLLFLVVIGLLLFGAI